MYYGSATIETAAGRSLRRRCRAANYQTSSNLVSDQQEICQPQDVRYQPRGNCREYIRSREFIKRKPATDSPTTASTRRRCSTVNPSGSRSQTLPGHDLLVPGVSDPNPFNLGVSLEQGPSQGGPQPDRRAAKTRVSQHRDCDQFLPEDNPVSPICQYKCSHAKMVSYLPLTQSLSWI